MDLPEMRGNVRRDLMDEDSENYRWSDNQVDRAIELALDEFSRYSPREQKNTIATSDGSPEIDISSLSPRLGVRRVEFPLDNTPRTFVRFDVYMDTLIMTTDGDGEDCDIYWTTVHTLDDSTSTIPVHLEDVVAIGAAAYAIQSLSQYSTGQATIGGATSDRDYALWARNKFADFRRKLRNIDRSIKQGQLFTGDET